MIGPLRLIDNIWQLHRGATEHVCFNINNFLEIKDSVNEIARKSENGSLVEVKIIEKVIANSWSGTLWG